MCHAMDGNLHGWPLDLIYRVVFDVNVTLRRYLHKHEKTDPSERMYSSERSFVVGTIRIHYSTCPHDYTPSGRKIN